MVRIFQVNELAQRKKILLAQSDLERQIFRLQVDELQESFAQLKKRFSIAGLSAAAFSATASIIGLLIARKKAPEKKRGLWSKIISGISMLTQVKSFFTRSHEHQENPDSV
jgi:hypothetical protein